MPAMRDLWPRPVPLGFGAAAHAVSCYTLSDLAALESWAAGRAGDARAVLSEAACEIDDDERRRMLFHAYDLALSGGPHLEEIAGELDTFDGMAVQLWVSVRRAEPGFAEADALALLPTITAPQWSAFVAVAWHLDPMTEVLAAIDRDAGVEVPPAPSSAAAGAWFRAVKKAISAGVDFRDLGDLPLSAWGALGDGPRVPPACKPRGWDDARWRAVEVARRDYWRPYFDAKRTKPKGGGAS